MAPTRGVNAKFPCPICLIPQDRLKHVTDAVVQRTHADGQDILGQTQTKAAREKDLQAKGLRNVEVSLRTSILIFRD